MSLQSFLQAEGYLHHLIRLSIAIDEQYHQPRSTLLVLSGKRQKEKEGMVLAYLFITLCLSSVPYFKCPLLLFVDVKVKPLQHEELLLLSFPLYCWSPATKKDEYIMEIRILFPVLLSRAEGCLKPEVSTIRKACALTSGQQSVPCAKKPQKKFNFQTLIISNEVNLASMSLKHIHM